MFVMPAGKWTPQEKTLCFITMFSEKCLLQQSLLREKKIHCDCLLFFDKNGSPFSITLNFENVYFIVSERGAVYLVGVNMAIKPNPNQTYETLEARKKKRTRQSRERVVSKKAERQTASLNHKHRMKDMFFQDWQQNFWKSNPKNKPRPSPGNCCEIEKRPSIDDRCKFV